MPFSRLYKYKDVITRTRNLVKGGIYVQGTQPKWLAVAMRFPPHRLPERYNYRFQPQLGLLIYPEDELRKLFYTTYDFRTQPLTLFGNEEKTKPMQLCDRYVKLQMQVMEEQALTAVDSQKIVEELMAESGEALPRLDQTDEYQR
ncbi:small ribosomal subunit protein mS23-like [Sycon ciliatum]|uniref:small ribosomal subunit protein mS23-like n=1 Tax=Sycon ciliatum TaxID=27933 RepID=UPI0031F6633F